MPASSSFALPFLFLLPSHLLCFLLDNNRVCTYSEMGATINELIKTETNTEHRLHNEQRRHTAEAAPQSMAVVKRLSVDSDDSDDDDVDRGGGREVLTFSWQWKRREASRRRAMAIATVTVTSQHTR